MRLFLYYVGHTFVNTIKKMMKTWVAIIIMIAVFGVIGGVIGGAIGSATSKHEQETETSDAGDVDTPGTEVEEPEEEGGSFFSFLFTQGLERNDIVELAISALMLLMIVLTLLNGKGLEEVFQPADVPMLFSAPMKPQSVMMFRLTTTLGMQVVFSLVMAFQIPNLTLNAGLPLFGAISLIIGWMILAVFVTLLQVFLYCVVSTNATAKKNLTLYIGIFFGAIAAIYLVVVVMNGNDLLKAAKIMFTGTAGYWVPFFGWIRGFCMNAITGNMLWCILFLAMNLAGMAAMVAIIWNLKVDFYEDALVAAERKAKKIAKAVASSKGEVVERDKARSQKLNRDGFHYGNGANVFFFKTLFNRFRLAWFKFLTKTMLVYLGVTIFVIVLSNIKNVSFGFTIACCAMIAVTFFRSLGNPLQEDISKEFFMMVPSSTRAKLFWSLLGGLANSALDMIIPYLVVVICMRPPVLEAVLWFPFILTIDLYGTITNTFVHLSVPMTLPKTIHTMIQVMFIYFGITPAIVFVVVGLILGNFAMFLGIGILANLMVSLLLFMLTPLLLQNGRK